MQNLNENEISKLVVNAAIKVHKAFGPGLLESVYETCLEYELKQKGLQVRRQVVVPVNYNGIELDNGFRIDLLVNNKVILELKTVEFLTDLHLAQVLTYLRLTDLQLGMLLNFNVEYMGKGIRRVVNNLKN